eukprot:s3508_g14.t2
MLDVLRSNNRTAATAWQAWHPVTFLSQLRESYAGNFKKKARRDWSVWQSPIARRALSESVTAHLFGEDFWKAAIEPGTLELQQQCSARIRGQWDLEKRLKAEVENKAKADRNGLTWRLVADGVLGVLVSSEIAGRNTGNSFATCSMEDAYNFDS